MAAILGPLLSYGVGHVKSGIKPYQGIFLCLGLVSLGLTSVVWWLMPNSPTTAKFLKNGNDRLIAIERLRENNTGTKSSKWQWYQVKETFIDPKSKSGLRQEPSDGGTFLTLFLCACLAWLWAAMYVCCATPSGGFGAFGGIITKGLGFTSFKGESTFCATHRVKRSPYLSIRPGSSCSHLDANSYRSASDRHLAARYLDHQQVQDAMARTCVSWASCLTTFCNRPLIFWLS